jgi:hypothetical protein
MKTALVWLKVVAVIAGAIIFVTGYAMMAVALFVL